MRPLSIALLSALSLMAASPEQSIMDLEKSFAQALVKSDVAALDRMLADDLTYYHSNGKLDNKSTYIDRIRSGAQKYVTFVYDDTTKVKVYGDTALLFTTAQVSSVTDGSPNTNHLRLLHVYRKQADEWKLLAHQSAKLPN